MSEADGDLNNVYTGEDPDLEAVQQKVLEMEEEAKKLREMQAEVEKQMGMGMGMGGAAGAGAGAGAGVSKEELDARSIYVGNVDYSATPEEVQSHFASCGTVNRVTILVDRFTGHPKGFAFVEFADPEAVNNAAALNDTVFHGRQIKVVPKRTNIPGIGFVSRSRGRRARFAGGAPPRGFNPYAPVGFRPRGFRHRRAHFSPY